MLCVAYLLCTTCSHAFHTTHHQRVAKRLSPLWADDYEETPSSSTRKKRIRPRRLSSSTAKVATERREENERRREQALQDPSLLTSMKFSDRPDLHPATKRALLELMGLEEMTEIQAKTYGLAVEGKSIVGRSRTGTGKTIAFLLPTIEKLLQGDKDIYIPGLTIGALIVAPTRELAQQIADEAAALLTYHDGMTVACLYGGTKMQRDINLLTNKRLPAILVATPGRLLDHLKETKLNGRKFSDIIGSTKIVVLDEMDALLSMGFQKDIRTILSFLPRKRQTLLFSATKPRSVRRLIQDVLRNDYEEVNCVDERDMATLTNAQVEQSFVILESMDQYLTALVHIVRQEDDNKIVIFLPTTKLVSFFADFLEAGLGMSGVHRLHSRMSQAARQRTSQAFRTSQRRSILVTTDVSSRGVDYPDVTLVVQYGSPDSQETYIHRLGRTGRAGRRGKGLQVVLPFEKDNIAELTRRGITEAPQLLDSIRNDSDKHIQSALRTIRSGDALLTPAAQGAYRSFLACYMARADEMDMTAREVVDAAASLSDSVGLIRPPPLEEKTAIRLGIANLVAVVDKE